MHADLEAFQGKRVLIVGGRQSGFETAALLAEEGAAAVHVVCRHPTPEFTRCDFSFMHEMIANIEKDPSWYRNLPKPEAESWSRSAYEQGRLKLEGWLAPRLKEGNVIIKDRAKLEAVALAEDQSLEARLDSGEVIACDHVIFATGFKTDIAKVPFLRDSALLRALDIREGSPVLDTSFQSNVSGLYFLGALSIASFGFPFGFSTGAPAAARIISAAISAH